jgi:hypothetical protein
MPEESPRAWLVRLGVFSPAKLYPFSVRDKSGLEFTAVLPDAEKTAAVQQGVNLVFKTSCHVSTPGEALEHLDPVIERLLNHLSFRLLAEVRPIALEIVEPLPEQIEREVFFVPSYSPLGHGRFRWAGFSFQGGVPPDITLEASDPIDASIRWFVQGMRGQTPIESFAGYWLAIENLASPVQEVYLRMRCCNKELQTCPNCGQSTLGTAGQRRRLENLFSSAGKDSEYFNRIWDLRNSVFHGSSDVFIKLMDIAKECFELRRIAIQLIKVALNMSGREPPLQEGNGSIVANIGLSGKYQPT